MNNKQMKLAGIICFVICIICVFTAIERYCDNAGKVEAMNSFKLKTPFADIAGKMDVQPATPPATKYAAFFAVLSGIGGTILIIRSKGNKENG